MGETSHFEHTINFFFVNIEKVPYTFWVTKGRGSFRICTYIRDKLKFNFRKLKTEKK